MLLERQTQKKDSTIVIASILFVGSYLFGMQYQVEWYILGLLFSTLVCVLFLLDIRIFYYIYFISFFIQLPVYQPFIIKLCLTDILFPFFVIVRLSSYIFEGKSLSSFIPDRKIKNILLLSFSIMTLSYLINFSGHTGKYQFAGIIALYRMVQPVIVFILFSEKDLPIDFSFIFPVFIIMTIIQIPVVIYQTWLYDLPLGVSIFITGTFSEHHSGMGTFLIIMLFLTYYNYLKTTTAWKKILTLALMCLVVSLILVSACRSAVFGLLISIIFMIVLNIKLKLKSILTLALFLVSGALFLYFSPFVTIVRKTLFSKDSGNLDVSSFSRIIIWKDSIKLFISEGTLQKILGIGTFFSGEKLKTSIFIGKGWYAAASHNNFLTALIETGIVGFILFVVLYGMILYRLFKTYKNNNNTFAFSLFLMTIALLGSCMTQETFWCHDFTGPLLSCYYGLLALVLTEDLNNKKHAVVCLTAV